MNQNIIDFYATLRSDAQLVQTFMSCESAEQLLDLATTEAQKRGFHFTKEEAIAAGMNIEALSSGSANDDELNDFELELISAGTQIKCSGGLDRQ